MYHALLTNRYLTTRVIPFIAVAAVALCTALVIIVVSVMSGFVDMVRNSGRTLLGDVIINAPITGFAHYDELILRIEALPEAAAATPMVDMYGILELPYGEAKPVQVFGIEPLSFHHVTGYADSLYWQPPDDRDWLAALRNVASEIWDTREARGFDAELITEAERISSSDLRRVLYMFAPESNRSAVVSVPERDLREKIDELLGPESWRDLYYAEPMLNPNLDYVLDRGRVLNVGGENGESIVPGIHVSDANTRRRDGTYKVVSGRWWMPINQVTLTLAPISRGNRILEPESRLFPVANEVQFGIFHVDNQRVLIPIVIAQRMLRMDGGIITDPNELDPDTFEPVVIGETPARVTHVLVRSADGVSPDALRDQVERVYEEFGQELIDRGDDHPLPILQFSANIVTWEKQNEEFIGPVEKERDLMRILFSIIYFVCAGLVLVIFWAIVYEKTRDIGILRSIGASRAGVLWIFVRYGLVVGIAGSIVGLGLAYLVVHNINHIHNTLGEPFPMWARISAIALSVAALVSAIVLARKDALLPFVVAALGTIALIGMSVGMHVHKGFLVWNPEVYYFNEIPNTIDTTNALITMAGAVVFSVIGALFPAARAADIDPVSALRYE